MQLNMFRASACPSSGAYQLQQQPVVYRRNVVVATRSLGRPKNSWEGDVKSVITKMKITNWKDCMRNRPKWKEFVEKPKTFLKL
jgi:hypothetical protein